MYIESINFIKVNDYQLFVDLIGEGEPIVFLHGGPGSEHRFFLPHMVPLSKKFKLVFYDQRGCGKSDLSENDQYSMKNEVENLEALRIQLGFEKMNLFGESWGSILALLYATTYPERVNKILLTAAIGVTSKGLERFSKELEKRLTEDDKIKISKWEENVKIGEASIEDLLQILDPYYVFSQETLNHKEKNTFSGKVNKAIGADIKNNYDVTENLHKISNIPILVAQGSHDILTPSIIKKLFSEHIPHLQLVEIEECGHWTVVEQPEKMCNVALSFFE
ncbi:alpha/beta fold hydrolase [Bacillus thuringiensis]|uniref:alpha/beta fold hydrolase n=1 Tax=Bacillus thuringiensis TaxID=1428 RepID=UPI000BEC71D7|nr:alpha/beta fold hydrolase [Bacillus thuringiensis]HDR8062606.1 alpha/beta fold hydrolase [Bacillus cereus]MEE3958970.1 alpha/beta fold hydrolase [Bacillus thuringiensis]PEC16162.1 proline iminopeptidase [Bacillus thuringiensis]PEY87588.1 proline iminopeptidase [Bacillus thuringiensis]PFD34604.1 proline iminopeptidase [Bacillus thuringiensis]